MALPLALAFLLGCGGARTRDLACGDERGERRREICTAISEQLKLAWGGPNRTVTPAYLLAPKDLKRVYCDARLTREDEPLLAAMQKETREPRLASASAQLRHLVQPTEQARGTRYHPEHPRYYLKDGCRPLYSAERR